MPAPLWYTKPMTEDLRYEIAKRILVDTSECNEIEHCEPTAYQEMVRLGIDDPEDLPVYMPRNLYEAYWFAKARFEQVANQLRYYLREET